MKYIALFLGIVAAIGGFIAYQSSQTVSIGGDLRTFISRQLSTSTPTSGYVLSTDGTINTWIPAAGGGSSKWTDGGTVIYPASGESVAVTSIAATGTATSTFTKLSVSDSLSIFGTFGTALSDFCVAITGGSGLCDGTDATGGGGGGITSFNGLTNATQTIAVATSSNVGIHVVSSGSTHTFTPTVATGYSIPLTASSTEWNAFYTTPSSRITAGTNLSWSSNTLNAATQISTSSTPGNLAYWTGTSALGNVATGTLTETVSGLQFDNTRALVGGSAILSLTSGFSIPSTTDITGWNLASSSRHSAVTLSGTLDYITLVGQDIVRGAIDLATDITGVLGIANGGLGAAFTDPNADRLMFWDDSSGFITGIATLTGAAISGTTLTINDVTCTDCLTSTEIADEYLFNTGDVGTGVYDFGGATSFEIPNGTGPAVDTLGEIGFDTTDNQFLVATGTSARAIPTITKLWAATIASSSIDFTSGGRISLPPHRDGVVITEVHCYVDGGTSKVINIDTMAGGAQLDSLTCATTLTSDTAQSANNNLSAGALMALEFGATTGSVDYVTFSAWGYVLPE